MCLAVPGQIVEVRILEPPFTSAIVDFGGVRRDVCMACVPHATVGDYVMVHAGIAISRVNAEEAARVLRTLRDLDMVDTSIDEPGTIM